MTTQPIQTRRPARTPSLLKQPVAAVSLAIIVVVSLAAALAPWIAPQDPLKQSLSERLQGPSAEHLLGTDTLGRDVLSRLIWGGQPTLTGVLVAVLVFTFVGVALGLLAGYFRGWADAAISALADILMSVPGVVLILAVLAIFQQQLMPAMVMLGALGAGSLVRVTRAEVMKIRGELYVSAAKVSGLRALVILVRHVLPGVVSPVIIQASLFAVTVLAVQTGLGFLNLGVIPPAPSWGGLVGEAAGNLAQAGWLLFVSGATITIVGLAFALVGDGLRDADAQRRTPLAVNVRRKRVTAPPATRSEGSAADEASALITVRDLHITFDSRPDPVVEAVSFQVERGEIIGLVGESGSGKTITSLAIMGLLPGTAWVSQGEILLDGVDVANGDDRLFAPIRGHRIGLISQEPMVALDPLFTIGSQLNEVLRSTVRGRAARRARALELLQSVHLPNPADVLKRYPFELSGGMAQRVVIALALAGDPDVLIADEPTTALDVTVQAGILGLLRELRDSRGLAVLLVTHDLGVVADICDRAIVMEHGRIVESADVEPLFANPQHPYTRALLSSTPSLVGAR
ncbi:dipeptide/oligopeptide/nickel ABC transporter permease/ATP-binding protein [Microbacterium sp.]|uniref:dipeptide/oligopeptide/nickel ABC transporter permease/ATP-binding protein n=1 Tax=Microbacterium sp. TaxID=51671 RepID=UPI003A8F4587